MSRPNTRKRPAPGSTPVTQQSAVSQPVPDSSNTSSLNDQQFLQWGQAPIASNGLDYGDPNALFDPALYNALANQSQASLNSQPSANQIARRPVAQQLVANSLKPYGDSSETGWMGYNDNGQPEVQPGEEWMNDEEEVERRAQIAKRDAQTKRKQIPPFIQKLKRYVLPEVYAANLTCSQTVSWIRKRITISFDGRVLATPLLSSTRTSSQRR